MSAGDYHIWKPGVHPPVALCGYTHEVSEENDMPIHPEPTGRNCEECIEVGQAEAPEVESELLGDDEGAED